MKQPDFRLEQSTELEKEQQGHETHSLWDLAVQSVPLSDIKLVRAEIKRGSTSDKDSGVTRTKDLNDEELRKILVKTRWSNPICGGCGRKGAGVKLALCLGCALEAYCSKDCQKAHLEVHKLRCGKQDGPLDFGYQQLAFVPVPKSSQISIGRPAKLVPIEKPV